MDGRRDGSLLPSSNPRLPSLSPLTGCVTPSTAATLMELSLKQLSQAPRRSWPTSQSAPSLSKARDEVSSLRQLAGRQLEQLQRAPGTPYQRTPTPAEHAAAEQKLARQLAHLAHAVQGAQQQSSSNNTQQEGGTELAAAAAAAAGGASRAGQPHSKAMTPAELVHLLRAMASASSTSRPPTTLSVQDVTLSPPHPKLPPSSPDPSGPPPPPPPAWSTLPGRSSPGSPGSSRPRSLLGSRGGLLRGSAPVPLGLLAAAAAAGTPPRSSSGAGCGAAGGGPGAAGVGGGEVWVNPGAMPPVSAAQRTRLLLGANMGNSATAEATGTVAPALAAAAAAAKLMSQRGVAPGGQPAQEGVQEALAAMAQARLQAGGQAGGPAGTGTAVCAGPPGAPSPACAAAPMLDKPALGAPGNPRWGPGQPLEHFVATRGLMYSVFSELDQHNAGKLTFSQFEEACVAVGLQQQQTQALYQQLDPHTRGYFTMKDWASKNHEKQVASFTRLYVQTTRGMHGRPADCSPEVKSATMALQVALNRLQLRNNGHVIRPERVLQAFEFIDADGSGSLSLAEVQDAFHGMGIFLTREALDEIVTAFDHNRNGSVEYAEFLNTLFPVTGKSYRRD